MFPEEISGNPVPAPAEQKKPQLGDIVSYVMSDSAIRPAIVVRVWENQQAGEMVNLEVFTDGLNDGARFKDGIFWATSVYHVETRREQPIANTWHWLRKYDALGNV